MKQATIDGRPFWQAPRLQELGNMRDFVQVGGAKGKSGGDMDGGSNCGGEAMGDMGSADCPNP